MLKANGVVPATAERKRATVSQPEVEDTKQHIVETDGIDEIKELEVCYCPLCAISIPELGWYCTESLEYFEITPD